MVAGDRKMKATGLVTNEVQNGATLARSYDFLGRPTGYTLRDSEVSCSYDSLGRLSTVASGTNLVSGYTCGGFSRTVAYEPYRDLVSAITNRFGSRVISTFEYTNDAAGRRTAIKRGGEAMGPLSGSTDAYGYNGRNEVVSARRTLGGSPVAGFNEDFAYDADGNQTLVTTGTGAWQVEYNGENRPVRWTRVSPDSSTPNSSTPTLVSMTFDHQGRRRLYCIRL